MSASGYSTPQGPTNGGPLGSFEDGYFIPHRDLATSESSTPRKRSTSGERPNTPEWYYDPAGLDHLNPVGVRNGASYPALEISGGTFRNPRDSVDGGYYKSAPYKRRRLSPTFEYIKEGVRRLWPTSAPPTLHRLALNCEFFQSEPSLDYFPLMLELGGDLPFTEYWASTGFAPTAELKRPVPLRTVSSPPVVTSEDSHRVRWWTPSPYTVWPSTSRVADGSELESEEDSMSEPVSPVTQVPVSPRIEGESKEDDLDAQMDALAI
jgi:hypothetical protein